MDYLRFMMGWGLWGNVEYGIKRSSEILDAIDGGNILSCEEYRERIRAKYAVH
jgi:hypothetical protein